MGQALSLNQIRRFVAWYIVMTNLSTVIHTKLIVQEVLTLIQANQISVIIDKYQVYYDLKEPDLSYIRTKQSDTHFGEIIYSNGAVYIGDLREGKPYGFGIMVYKNRDAYIGTFENGLPEGQGAIVYLNSGSCYHGQFHNNQLNGRVTYIIGKDGSVYHNMYKNGTYEGTAPAL